MGGEDLGLDGGRIIALEMEYVMVGLGYGGDKDYFLDEVVGESRSCRELSWMVGSYFVSWDI